MPGDSGAWVFEASTGRVCGHVLAWSERSRTAYIAPMQVLLEDISRTLGACAVTLPGSSGDDGISAASMSRIYDQQQTRRFRDVPIISEHLPIELGRLSLNNFDEPAATASVRPSINRAVVGNNRNHRLAEVSSPYHRSGPPPIMTRAGRMERQPA